MPFGRHTEALLGLYQTGSGIGPHRKGAGEGNAVGRGWRPAPGASHAAFRPWGVVSDEGPYTPGRVFLVGRWTNRGLPARL